jgi:conjugal transfer/entry exclusion protein
MSWLSELPELPKRVWKLERRINMAEVNLTGLKDEVEGLKSLAEAQDAVIKGVTQDYATMQAQIAALEAGQGDPVALQAAIDAIKTTAADARTKLAADVAALVALDESVPPPAPPQP